MRKYLIIIVIFVLTACDGSNGQDKVNDITWEIIPNTLSFSGSTGTKKISVKSNGDWTAKADQSWCSATPSHSYKGTIDVNITVTQNPTENPRSCTLTFSSGSSSHKYTVAQAAGDKISNFVPAGYTLKFQDEFNDARISGGKTPMPNADKWYFETGAGGWGNNEIQNYISGFRGTDTCAVISDGTLKIIAKKVGSEVLSIRMNTKESWQYGYFEARLRMPSGKGTWPAFWMMPKDMSLGWPTCGEIDIMEYVGYNPNIVHSTVHTKAYNHMIGTQKGKSTAVANAETEFHIYAVEWTVDYIRGFVDGKQYFEFLNDKQNNVETWPFNKPFYLKLNLAWGGNWGGAQGVDEAKLPATYEIDYVRVYQK
ncbi:MAG: family 16 glycosylhydrolase [Petrimonas sp.]|jgi:hypothetical protein